MTNVKILLLGLIVIPLENFLSNRKSGSYALAGALNDNSKGDLGVFIRREARKQSINFGEIGINLSGAGFAGNFYWQGI